MNFPPQLFVFLFFPFCLLPLVLSNRFYLPVLVGLKWIMYVGFFFFGHTTCRILFLQPGIKPAPLQWKHRVLTIGLPGNSHNVSNFHSLDFSEISLRRINRAIFIVYELWKYSFPTSVIFITILMIPFPRQPLQMPQGSKHRGKIRYDHINYDFTSVVK